MIYKSRCDNGFIWNPSICECACDKSCNRTIFKKLYKQKLYMQKKLTDKLVEKCDKDNVGNEMIHNVSLNECGKVCQS